ncbi:hypothetical protein [Demequina rhizosphaerae]|uniref:hypothetical protein n=1 Tax=Demequina rhizosphaerae TaxID=1638985 RepID=UPI00078342E6|nr:hypothetical protein [Demequina rhizosphaerae]
MQFSYALGLARQLVLAVTAVAVIEIPVAHLLLSRWSTVVAVVITALSATFIGYVVVDWAAAVRRPITLDSGTLTLRRGLRRPVEVPVARIVAVRSVPSSDGLTKEALRTLYAGEANALVEVEDGSAHAVALDDPAAFVQALEAVIGPAHEGLESQA